MSSAVSAPRRSNWTRWVVLLTDLTFVPYALSWLAPRDSALWAVHHTLLNVACVATFVMFCTVGLCRTREQHISTWSTQPLWGKLIRVATLATMLVVTAIRPQYADVLVFPIILWIGVFLASWLTNRKAARPQISVTAY